MDRTKKYSLLKDSDGLKGSGNLDKVEDLASGR